MIRAQAVQHIEQAIRRGPSDNMAEPIIIARGWEAFGPK